MRYYRAETTFVEALSLPISTAYKLLKTRALFEPPPGARAQIVVKRSAYAQLLAAGVSSFPGASETTDLEYKFTSRNT